MKLLKAIIIAGLGFITLDSIAQEEVSLAGNWQVRLDSQKVGIDQKWYNVRYEREIKLPGTLDDAGIGEETDLSADQLSKDILIKLTRKHSYIGPAWYSKDITIPKSWQGKNVHLFLERVIWNTRVWIDGKEAGTQESLSVPHRFDLGALLKPGTHHIAVRIDNSKQHDISHKDMAHAYTDGTQIIWNGIIGKIKLVAKDKLSIDAVHTYPDVQKRSVRISSVLKSDLKNAASATLQVQVFGKANQLVANKKVTIKVPSGVSRNEVDLPLGKDAALWDEFNANLYKVEVRLAASKPAVKDLASASFGLREITNKNSQIQVNGRRIFIRGTLECNIFPLTGHPPMEKEGWLKVFNTAKEYGLNHLRFHSWCPPEAAFQVADSLGFYLQVELPLWSLVVGKDANTSRFLEEEARKISDEYGNHPSFCLWSLGNELQGDFDWLAKLMKDVKAYDPRHLYTTTTFTFQKDHGKWPEPLDEYYITQYTTKGWVRGQGIFNTYPPNFSTDYTKAIDGLPVPIITHEIGQYSVYPNLEEIKKYTGVLDPLNFKSIRNDLQKKGMLDLAPSFTLASGKFSANLYKEEIERALKTRGMSGFQLLDLHDFPGQGTALVGILDAFWDSKGLASTQEHRMYCSEVVPLIRFNKAIYVNSESFSAEAEVANFSNKAFSNTTLVWTVKDRKGTTLFRGELNSKEIPLGNGTIPGKITFPLKDVKQAEELTIELQLKGTSYKNRWNIWVYPENVPVTDKEVVVTQSLSEAVLNLNKGKNVLLNPDTASIYGVQGRFAPVFWSPVHFPDQPGTMGILCDPQHPALKDFPTAFYSNWQWWDLITSSKSMVIDSIPSIKPIVRVIDNFYKNRKMANVIEAKVGKGKLILTSTDLSHNLDKRPAARQLRYSLQQYMKSNQFAPSVELTEKQLEYLVKK